MASMHLRCAGIRPHNTLWPNAIIAGQRRSASSRPTNSSSPGESGTPFRYIDPPQFQQAREAAARPRASKAASVQPSKAESVRSSVAASARPSVAASARPSVAAAVQPSTAVPVQPKSQRLPRVSLKSKAEQVGSARQSLKAATIRLASARRSTKTPWVKAVAVEPRTKSESVPTNARTSESPFGLTMSTPEQEEYSNLASSLTELKSRLEETMGQVDEWRLLAKESKKAVNPPTFKIIHRADDVRAARHGGVNHPSPVIHEGKMYRNEACRKGNQSVSLEFLRDHCQCAECIHPVTKQRVLEIFDKPRPQVQEMTREGNGVEIKWDDGHKSYYGNDWLAATIPRQMPLDRQGLINLSFFSGWQLREWGKKPEVEYDQVMASDRGVGKWTELIRRWGFCYVNNTPPTPEATKALLERIAFIRPTHYGGFWDFTSDLSFGDTAYTDLAIGAHTDTTYFTDPCGLQMFHLLSHENGSGGESLLVDGFAAATDLMKEDPEAYQILSTVLTYSHASGTEGMSIQPYQPSPVLVHDRLGNLSQIRWNTTDRAQIDMPVEVVNKWYDAARKWVRMLKRREYWEQLKPGQPMIFDNWRVLHGRSKFTGKRRLCGGYISRDDFISRFKMTNWGKDAVLEQVSRPSR
ncbi:Trimethyllysine dioxygenase [Aulographum hederae CBS 113979]|uniref:trimethyllysine dioxygenase n=1 Tax=Aulographum hederae CBS 113979 TaxID=1176131 RepID=A0A6G1H2E7_9PEZI|nr:Trimethyllysine dioxygenase [Aulographum hederae CBS 113979]